MGAKLAQAHWTIGVFFLWSLNKLLVRQERLWLVYYYRKLYFNLFCESTMAQISENCDLYIYTYTWQGNLTIVMYTCASQLLPSEKLQGKHSDLLLTFLFSS